MNNTVKVYRMVVEISDFEGNCGFEEAISAIENLKYYSSHVVEVKEVSINDWDDDHPLNQHATHRSTFDSIFKDAPVVYSKGDGV